MLRIAVCLIVALMLSFASIAFAQGPYAADWVSLDTRPIPAWFNEAKFGIFIVWGPYSVPGWKDRGYAEWYGAHMLRKDSPTQQYHHRVWGADFTYEQFAPLLTASNWDPDGWCDLFARAGARYVVNMANYHDGFAMYPTEYAVTTRTDVWNSMEVGPKRDIVGELKTAGDRRGLKMGIYYSLYEWWHPLWVDEATRDRYTREHFHPKFKEVVSRYKPCYIFLDGEWEADYQQWRSEELAAWLYNESPCREYVVTNDRWGKTRGKHGDTFSSEYGGGKGWGDHPWQEDRGIGRSYGYNRNETLDDYDSADELIAMLIKCAANGGNYLLCVGPTADGRIPVIMQQRLLDIGAWMKVNGEAIYGTRSWRTAQSEQDEKIRYTVKGDTLYVICTAWPGEQLTLEHPEPPAGATITMLGTDSPVSWRMEGGKLVMDVPQLTIDKLPCRHAWVFRIPGAAK